MVFNSAPKPPSKFRLLLKKRRFRIYPLKQKGLSLLPNLFTLGNAFFGFSSLVLVANDELVAGAYLILLGGLMDMLDGRIARYTGTSSELGLQLDSLCDALSFCVGPAFLMYFWSLESFGLLGFFACAFFALTGILRLARFNITHDAQTIYFLGLPTTMAATTLLVIFLNYQDALFTRSTTWFLLGSVMLLSILMVSRIKFPTLKHLKKGWYALGVMLAIAFLMIFGCIKVGLIMLGGYFFFAIAENIRIAILRRWSMPR